MKASDIMSSPVICVPPDASVREVAGLLFERRISAVPVLEGERLVGLVSEADVLRRRRQLGGLARRAVDIMTREVETVAPDTPVEQIAALLEERGIKRVPVLQAGRVVGIVSRSNLVQALAAKALPEAPHREDEAIRTRLLSRLQGMPGWRQAESNVVVVDGVVHYWGDAGSEQERDAARAAAERIPGVRRVEDHRHERPKRPAAASGSEMRRASERGHSKHGWVDLYHSFSFGNFYDPAYTGYGPLRAINENVVRTGGGSTTYGLSDIEVITYMLDGELRYDDSRDHSAVLSAGGVQCLSAGSGVRFSEANRSLSQPSRFLQVWLEPNSIGLPAAYGHAEFNEDSKRGRLRVVVSPDGRDGSLRMRQEAVVYAGLFDGAEHARFEAAPGRLAYVHVARGEITVQGRPLGAGDGLATTEGTVGLEGGRDAEVLVLDLPEGPAGAGIDIR